MRHSLDEKEVEKALRKTNWELADELEEEAKEHFLEELYDGKLKKKTKAINF